ncbi:uncharacterized protein LOC143809065 [Ranitomeya variabilis]|uniref:uncharacterized protein LOC143809065 n=1 Tax=Ranitomeya variabilis TaxID=490064 RepID=UPI0040579AB0
MHSWTSLASIPGTPRPGISRTGFVRGVTRDILSPRPIRGRRARTRSHFFPQRDGVRRHRQDLSRTLTIVGNRLVYVGQTSQELKKRVQKHISTIHLAASDSRKDLPVDPFCWFLPISVVVWMPALLHMF